MKINLSTDYAIRVLLFAATHPTRLVTIKEIAETYQISDNHLMKIVHTLQKNGYLHTVRGRNGGFRLAKAPENISIGEIIMIFEDMVYLKNEDPISSVGDLPIRQTLDKAYLLFFEFLQSITLDEMVDTKNK